MNHLRNALWMQERGHSVHVFCVANSRFHKEALQMQLRVVPIKKHRKYYDFGAGRALVGLLKKYEITHLLTRSTRDLSILAYAKSRLKGKLHTSYFMEMQLGVDKTNFLHTQRFKGIDLWACPLPWLVKQVETRTHYQNSTVLIPSGMDLDQFSNLPTKNEARALLNLPENRLLFGLIGRFDVQKGQLLLLEAMKTIQTLDFDVVLLGEPTFNEGDDYADQIQHYITENDWSNRVHIRPFNKQPEHFYTAIDWLVMATKAETFGMVTIEALACGTPVLGSNAGGTPEIIGTEGGLLFESMNANDLGEQMKQICNNHYKTSPAKLKAIAQQYDHHKVCALVEKHLNLK